MAASKRNFDDVLRALRTLGLSYPGTHLKSPWPGHADLAVRDKTFAYLSVEGEPFKLSCKLPHSGTAALSLPFTEPTGYGLGKSGWVTARFEAGASPPLEILQEWIEESYRAQAPKKLSAQLAGASPAPVAPAPKRARKVAPTARKQPTSRKKPKAAAKRTAR